MLNRRILRVKAVQALYAYFTAVESIKEVTRDHLREIHALDPAKHDFSDKAHFEARKKQAVRLFNQAVFSGEFNTEEQAEEEVLKNVKEAFADYNSQVAKESRLRKAEMMKDARELQDVYIKFLVLPIEIEQREKLDKEKDEKAKIEKKKKHYPFIGDHVVEALKNAETLQRDVEQRSVSWSTEHDDIKSWYREHIRKTDTLMDYFEGFAADDHLVLEVFKKSIFKNEVILSYFDRKYLHWAENLPIVKSMVVKTFKGLSEGTGFEYAELTKNGEEDFQFLEKLYADTLSQNEFLDEIISKNTQNWEVERIALTDRVILKVALVEMMNSPSIPVKVSINEAIEISKAYSTPKSKQFINGVLDVLSNELTSSGKIRKSGRGLIDNQ